MTKVDFYLNTSIYAYISYNSAKIDILIYMYMFFEKKQWLQDQNDSNDIHVKDVLALDACTFVYTVSVMQMSRWAWTLEIYCCQLPSCMHQAKFEKNMKIER